MAAWMSRLAFLSAAVRSTFLQHVTETVGARLLVMSLGFVISVILSRVLGPEGRGLYAIATTVGALGVQFGDLGQAASNTYRVARDRRELSPLLSNSLLISAVLGGTGAVLAWLVFSARPEWAPVPGALLLLSLAWLPAGLAYRLLLQLVLGLQELRTYNLAEVFLKGLAALLICGLALAGAATVDTAFGANLAALLTGLVWLVWRLGRAGAQVARAEVSLLKDSISYGLRAYWIGLFEFIVMRSDLLLMRYVLGSEQAGYYAVAMSIGEVLYLLPSAVGTILFPRLAAASDPRQRWLLARKATLATASVMCPLVAIAGLLVGPTITLIFGPVFAGAVPAFLWLAPGVILLSLRTVVMGYFARLSMPPLMVAGLGVAAALSPALNLVLIPSAGIVGAAITWTLLQGVILAIGSAYIWKDRPWGS